MKKNNKKYKALISIIIFCMVAMYGFMTPVAKAASLIDVKDTISTSRPGLAATHVIKFTVLTNLAVGDDINITFPGTFNVGAAVPTCPTNTNSLGFTGQVLTCDVTTLIATSTALTATTTDVTNPAKVSATVGLADTYQIYIETAPSTGGIYERADAMVAIVEPVTMSATIEATLSFQISAVATGQSVNGFTTTADSTATTTPFGTLSTTASSTVAQQLNVSTNATDGYVVTVQQDHELLSNSGDTINSFDNSLNDTGSTTPHAWNAPSGLLDNYHTYGHMGLTTNDADQGGTFRNFTSGSFYGGLFAGLNGTSTMAVMSHDGPADGTTQNVGLARVAYSIQITALQEAGDYTSTLTYICTPQY